MLPWYTTALRCTYSILTCLLNSITLIDYIQIHAHLILITCRIVSSITIYSSVNDVHSYLGIGLFRSPWIIPSLHWHSTVQTSQRQGSTTFTYSSTSLRGHHIYNTPIKVDTITTIQSLRSVLPSPPVCPIVSTPSSYHKYSVWCVSCLTRLAWTMWSPTP